jgi:hypothetical protein
VDAQGRFVASPEETDGPMGDATRLWVNNAFAKAIDDEAETHGH